ncbi:hypothetical protein [Amycolatopsis benzoatilytica]|uniref:hypothetical protein n=1 Tax=Amycolatopsis benzoatilytica TaxID=346045 RepID=UPI00036DEB33|nr:hypothetical protein [Amycolatopsis benzoatilytica]
MIVLVLAVLSLASLVTGYLTDRMVLVEVSFGLSVLGAAILAATAIRRRRAKRKNAAEPDEDEADVAEAEGSEDVEDVEDVGEAERTPALVVVVPGRRRYHVPECESVRETAVEELTADEAVEEGFSPCTRCHPSGEHEEAALVSAKG